MPLDLPPPPKLWLPPKPAIIRASDLPRSYAEAKKIAHKPDIGTFPFPTFVPSSPGTFRYLRLTISSTAGATSLATLWELDWSNDGGSTLYPTSNMTTNSAPSPLVALADSEFSGSFQAFQAFDGNNATRWASANTAMPHWIQVDLGSGNGIKPNWIRWRVYNDGTDYSPASGNMKGSNTGSFSGEETTFASFSGLSGNADGTNVTRTW